MGATKFVGEAMDYNQKEVLNARQHNITTAQRTSMGLALNANHKGIHVWDTDENVAYYWSGSEWISASGVPQYTDEKAQDAVGAILTDTDTIDLDYDDNTNQITANVRRQMSIVSHASGIKLDGDVGSPGNNKYYGTNSEGVKGWHSLPAGTDPGYGFGRSIVNGQVADLVTLVNDENTPGNSKYYGTNNSGVKGWYGLPNNGISFVFPASVVLNDEAVNVDNALSLVNDQTVPGNLKYYGTNNSGVKGWYSFPSKFGVGGYEFRYSIVGLDSSFVNLVNDVETPGNSKYYGTNVSGLRGWFDLPTGSGTYLFVNGLNETGGTTKLGGALTENTDISDNGAYKLSLSKNVANTDALEETLRLVRNTSGTAANGIGSSIDWYIESNAGGTAQYAGKIGIQLKNAISASRSGQFDVYLIDGASDPANPQMSVHSTGMLEITRGIKTGIPEGGVTATKNEVKFGALLSSGGLLMDATQYFEIEVNGVIVPLAIAALP